MFNKEEDIAMATDHDTIRQLKTRDGRRMRVTRLQPGDEADLRAFNNSLSDDSKHLFTPHGYNDETLAKVTARSQTGDDAVFAVWDGEAIVGYYFLWNARARVPLLGIGFTDCMQGQGLGRQAMEHLIAEAKASKREGIELTTDLSNDRAYALYESLGFEYLRDVNNLVGDGTTRTERAMFLPLKDGAEPMAEPHAPLFKMEYLL